MKKLVLLLFLIYSTIALQAQIISNVKYWAVEIKHESKSHVAVFNKATDKFEFVKYKEFGYNEFFIDFPTNSIIDRKGYRYPIVVDDDDDENFCSVTWKKNGQKYVFVFYKEKSINDFFFLVEIMDDNNIYKITPNVADVEWTFAN